MRVKNQAIRAAETTKVIHMPIRCRWVARAISAICSGREYSIRKEYKPTASVAMAATQLPGKDKAATATGNSSKETSGLVAPPVRYSKTPRATRSTAHWPASSGAENSV